MSIYDICVFNDMIYFNYMIFVYILCDISWTYSLLILVTKYTMEVVDTNGLRYHILNRSNQETDPKGSVKNCWRWDWLASKDKFKQFLSDYIVKIDVNGQAFCKYCKCTVSYGSGGKAHIVGHATKHPEHKKYLDSLKNSSQLPVAYTGNDNNNDAALCLPYGAAPNVTNNNTVRTSSHQPSQPKRSVHIIDRVHHLEGLALSFICEHSLP